jgi:predicted N-acetyltransferase YhbS
VSSEIHIREETEGDWSAVYALNVLAFGSAAEARLVDALRDQARPFGIDSDYGAPEEAFMAVELQPGALRGKSGRATFHPAFDHL